MAHLKKKKKKDHYWKLSYNMVWIKSTLAKAFNKEQCKYYVQCDQVARLFVQYLAIYSNEF